MKIIHTADWHLGRAIFGERLLEDQAYALETLLRIIKDVKPEAVVIAGDVFDRPVPPAEAVELLDDFLFRAIVDGGAHVMVIAGNHDSPVRIEHNARLLRAGKLHVCGSLRSAAPVALGDSHGKVVFCPVAYIEPLIARDHLKDELITCHESAMKAVLDRVYPGADDCRRVLVAHTFAAGCSEADSERPLSVGGAEKVNCSVFHRFTYTMLGHLHGPQWAEQGRVRYAGSLLKYSFSEWKHVKGVDLVELGAQDVKVEQIPITPRRDLVKIEGYLDALISEPRLDMKDDYLLARLHDEGPLIDPMARLKTVYPNVLALERSSRPQSERTAELLGDHRRRSHSELFSAFYNYVWDAPPDKDQQAAFQNVLETLQIREREADEAAEA